MNGQRLVQFEVKGAARTVAAQGIASATLWIRVEPRSSTRPRNLTLWAFRVTRPPPFTNVTRLTPQVCRLKILMRLSF